MVDLLSNFDLENLYNNLNIKLNAVLNKDLLNTIEPKIGNYIINLQNSYAGGGTHWTAFIIKKDITIYFDSYGVPPPNILLNFIHRFNKSSKIIYSIDQIQHYKSVLCGYYCLYFHYYFNKNKIKNYTTLLNKHNSLYVYKNRKLNDKILQELIKRIFK